jgi:tricorn protease
VQIDFDGLQQRVIAVPGVPERQYSQLKAGVAGTVFYLEAPAPGTGARGSTLHRYQLTRTPRGGFVANVAEYASAPTAGKLLYRTPAPEAPAAGRRHAANQRPSLFLVDADKQPPTAGGRAAWRHASHAPRSEGRVPADLRRGLAPAARLPLRAEHARHRLAAMKRCTARCCRT